MRCSVLIVDNDNELEKLIDGQSSQERLSYDHNFIFASSDNEALEILKSRKDIDIAAVAIDSDGVSGMGIFHKLGDTKIRVPRIAMTKGHDLKIIREAMNEGAVDFLTKPITMQDLIGTLDKVFKDCEGRRKIWRTEAQLAAIRKEIDIAGELQKKILPNRFPDHDELAIYAQMTPANQMGGDFYDFFEIAPDKIGLVVADVSGKGVPAAFFMAVSRTLIRATGTVGVSPAECLKHVNNLLCHHEITGMFVSVFYGILNTTTWELTFSNGGHLPPYLVPGDGGDARALTGGASVVLGVQEGLDYEQDIIALNKGDILFFYTDGLTEAFDKERNQFSEQRLIECLLDNRNQSVHALANNVFAFLNAFTGNAPQSDDITSLTIKRF